MHPGVAGARRQVAIMGAVEVIKRHGRPEHAAKLASFLTAPGAHGMKDNVLAHTLDAEVIAGLAGIVNDLISLQSKTVRSELAKMHAAPESPDSD